jgi:hypothetical protein
MARELGISRASLYYKHKLPARDEALRREIERVMEANPGYGSPRVALALEINEKRAARAMRKFGLKPARRSRTPRKRQDEGRASLSYPNLLGRRRLRPTWSGRAILRSYRSGERSCTCALSSTCSRGTCSDSTFPGPTMLRSCVLRLSGNRPPRTVLPASLPLMREVPPIAFKQRREGALHTESAHSARGSAPLDYGFCGGKQLRVPVSDGYCPDVRVHPKASERPIELVGLRREEPSVIAEVE